jgi:hypothetical protein
MSLTVKLNLPRGTRQRHFLDYLNSALRSRIPGYNGSASVFDGFFKSKVSGAFLIDNANVPLTWQLVNTLDSTLLHLDVICEDSTVPEESWKTATYELVTSVLTAALAEKQQQFFRRTLFFYIGVQLDGEYWLPGFRIAPAYVADPYPYIINAERVLALDMNINAIDDIHANILASEAARRHAARISLLLDVGLYIPKLEQRWVLPDPEDKTPSESIRRNLGFHHLSIHITTMPSKGALCQLGQYKGSLTERYRVAGQLLSLPPQARKILRGIESASPAVMNAFDSGSRLSQVASVVGHQFPSVGLAYRIAAVEAIAKCDPSAPSFGEFMRKHTTARAGIDQLLDYMYGSVRSGHFHAGEFPLGEFDRASFFGPLMDFESLQQTSIHRACYEVTREAIVNWMASLVPDTAGLDVEETDNATLLSQNASRIEHNQNS